MQLFYFNGVEVSPKLVWDDSKGLNFEDQDLSNDLFTRQELLDVKNRKSRQEFLFKDADGAYDLKIQIWLNLQEFAHKVLAIVSI